jgi:hypothetical protein
LTRGISPRLPQSEGGARADQVTDPSRITFHGVEMAGAPGQPREFAPEPLQILDPLIEVGGPSLQELGHVLTRRFTALA